MKFTFSAVVESGSHSEDYQRWEEIDHCGHAHRSIDAARQCLEKKTRWYCMHGKVARSSCKHCLGYAAADHTSAHWYNGTIHNHNGERV